MGFVSRTFGILLKLTVIFLIITFVPGIPPDMEFEAYTLTPSRPLEGALAVNNKLNNAERLFEDEIRGPEHLEVHNGVLYTTLDGGYVAKIVADKIIPVVKFGKKCEGLYEPEVCGRPLGLAFDRKGFMYAVDAYYGVFKVNTSTGEYEQLVSMDTEIEKKVPKLPNSVTVAKDGTIYWTDSTTSHYLQDGFYTMLGNGNGRLIKYDPKTKINTVLIDKLHFANGVALSRDESFVLVSDLLRSRVMKYNLKGPNTGKSEVFLDGLPGFPDNLHSTEKGEFHISLALDIDKGNPSLTAMLGPYPLVRKLLARLTYLLELPALQLNMYYPNFNSKVYSYWIGSFSMVPQFMLSQRSSVIFFNEDGKITRSLYATDKKICCISDFVEFNNFYYLGSFSNPYLARVKAS
uniref:Strictosidine synthase conserved region domain-containing protein n=1 Tax=Homalodisca liturata TaxID=320908 RepID=A0A1B6I6F1_9HEMI